MAIVTAPLLSFAGSGTFADVLTASSLRGRAVMRRKPRARQAWTAAQRSHYARLSFLQASWRTLPNHTPAGLQAMWQPTADGYELPLFQAYVKSNYARWSNTLSPIIAPGQGGTSGSGASSASASGGHGFIEFLLTQFNSNNQFGAVYFLRANGTPVMTVEEIALVEPKRTTGTTATQLMITHLTPGLWSVRMKPLRTDGTMGALAAQHLNLVVT